VVLALGRTILLPFVHFEVNTSTDRYLGPARSDVPTRALVLCTGRSAYSEEALMDGLLDTAVSGGRTQALSWAVEEASDALD
jgi:hypothetical protein